MNLILIHPGEIQNDRVAFSDHRADHIRTVLNSSPGDTLRTGIVNGPLCSSRVLEIADDKVILEITRQGTAPPRPDTDLILALPRPIMLKRILSQAASLGVSRIYLVNANRVEKSFFNASLLHANAYNTYLHHGLEQAVDTFLPELSIHPRFKPFVEDLLPKINNDYPVRLVAHPEAEMTLPERITPPLKKRVLLAIGPEGGWVDYEISKFQEQGMQSFAMGPRILKVDTAVAALLAQINLLRQIGSTEAPGCRK